MDVFDAYAEDLFDKAKYFLERAELENEAVSEAFLYASLLLGVSSLEAYVNSIAKEIADEENGFSFSVFERGFLLEKETTIDHGEFVICSKLKMSRLIERIEFIYYHFSHKKTSENDEWLTNVKNTITIRNNIVHPKEKNILTKKMVQAALRSILECINILYKEIYNRPIPVLNYDLQSTIE